VTKLRGVATSADASRCTIWAMGILARPRLLAVRSTHFVTLCGRIFINTDPQYFPRAEYRGRTIYFCTDSCLGAFLADPERFYRTHRNANHKDPQSAN
jgi:YHS domain-containing protein